jgi:soluble lytic murein transglycosylase-like protein
VPTITCGRASIALLFCAFTLPALAGENAILSNGFRIHADRHETLNGVVRLFTTAGVIEFPSAQIAEFEQEEYVAPEPVAPVKAGETVAPAAPVETPKTPRQLVEDAAIKAGLPPSIVHSVAKAESGYRPDALSRKGAIGLMQLMPGTAAQLQADPHDPKQNAEAGAMYLRELLIKYDGDVAKALAAYNAGPGAVDKYNGVPPYAETRSYVNRVISDYKKRSGVAE